MKEGKEEDRAEDTSSSGDRTTAAGDKEVGGI
jgi:hypothetical protein